MAEESQAIVAFAEGPGDSESITISSCARKCDNSLANLGQDALASPYHILSNALTDEAQRFKIWAANIGALQPPNSSKSLDFRLERADRMSQAVLSGLEGLEDALNRGEPHPTRATCTCF